MKRIWLWAVIGMALANVAVADTVYRWKDASGQLNYGTQPPPGVKAEPLGDRGSVTVMPAPAVPAAPAASSGTAARVERLERELEEERRLRREDAAREQDEEARRAQARAECERQYREPCDEEGRPLGSSPSNYIVVPRTYRAPYDNYPPHSHDGRPGKGGHDGRGDDHGGRPSSGGGKPQPSTPAKASVRAGTVPADERLAAPR